MEEIIIVDDNKDLNRDLCEDISVDNVPKTLSEIERELERLKQKWGEFTYLIGQRLKYILDHKLYEQNNYPNFKTYVNTSLKMSENNAYYYIAVFEYFTEKQTKLAGSKLKLLLPILNNIKREKSLDEKSKMEKIQKIRDELFYKIYNKSYREAEDYIKSVKNKYFKKIDDIKKSISKNKIIEKLDKIIIKESDPLVKARLLSLIKDFYNNL